MYSVSIAKTHSWCQTLDVPENFELILQEHKISQLVLCTVANSGEIAERGSSLLTYTSILGGQ